MWTSQSIHPKVWLIGTRGFHKQAWNMTDRNERVSYCNYSQGWQCLLQPISMVLSSWCCFSHRGKRSALHRCWPVSRLRRNPPASLPGFLGLINYSYNPDWITVWPNANRLLVWTSAQTWEKDSSEVNAEIKMSDSSVITLVFFPPNL